MKKLPTLVIAITLLLALGVGGLLLLSSRDSTTEFSIKEAGIKMTLPKTIADLYYIPPSVTPNAYYFSTQKITGLDGQCSAQALSLGAMYIFGSKTIADQYVQDIGKADGERVTTLTATQELDGKFYVFDGGSNQYCSSKQEVKDLQKKLSEIFIEAGKSIQKQ